MEGVAYLLPCNIKSIWDKMTTLDFQLEFNGGGELISYLSTGMTNCTSLFFRRSIVYQLILRWNWVPHSKTFKISKISSRITLPWHRSIALLILTFISDPIYFKGEQDCPKWVCPVKYFRTDNVIYPEVFNRSNVVIILRHIPKTAGLIPHFPRDH